MVMVGETPRQARRPSRVRMTKTDLGLLLGLLSLLAALGLSPVLLLASLTSLLVGRAMH